MATPGAMMAPAPMVAPRSTVTGRGVQSEGPFRSRRGSRPGGRGLPGASLRGRSSPRRRWPRLTRTRCCRSSPGRRSRSRCRRRRPCRGRSPRRLLPRRRSVPGATDGAGPGTAARVDPSGRAHARGSCPERWVMRSETVRREGSASSEMRRPVASSTVTARVMRSSESRPRPASVACSLTWSRFCGRPHRAAHPRQHGHCHPVPGPRAHAHRRPRRARPRWPAVPLAARARRRRHAAGPVVTRAFPAWPAHA